MPRIDNREKVRMIDFRNPLTAMAERCFDDDGYYIITCSCGAELEDSADIPNPFAGEAGDSVECPTCGKRYYAVAYVTYQCREEEPAADARASGEGSE